MSKERPQEPELKIPAMRETPEGYESIEASINFLEGGDTSEDVFRVSFGGFLLWIDVNDASLFVDAVSKAKAKNKDSEE